MSAKPRQFLSDQEFFEAAWLWLVIENHPRCDNPLEAVYRDGDKRCVIGAFIPEELYQLNFPDDPIMVLLHQYPEFREWFRYLTPELMRAVEEVHNAPRNTQEIREKEMRTIAEIYNLKCPEASQNNGEVE